ncbi:zinc-binding alcohol dehydrogenase family protein [Paenibacillus koleovorans]|uniref:zinc-binding alcohol dehydrogenase family protein n=1 Tax=Paenibacillus koleovorans TaxID=121608 RepID=UPI000FDABC20|nr:zinc-binding alcohol dehydrogenase family protein [Paenibacillus koleovorans]
MKGIVCQEVNRLQYVEMREPELKPGEAIVRIRRIGICGTDLHAYRGNQPFFSYPRVLGHELAGIVEAIGDNPEGLRPGDPVGIIPYFHCGACVACRSGKTNCCVRMQVFGVHVDGGMRELVAVPTRNLLRADGLTLDQAAMLEPFAIGAHAVRRSGLGEGDTALVIGAGPIGLGAMAFAKLSGAKVIAMDVQDDRLTFCRSWAGVDATVLVSDGPLERLAELTGGDMPGVVLDATGNARSMTDSFGYVAHGGTLVYVGLVKADIAFHNPEFHKRELTLMGSRNATREDFERVIEGVRCGAVDVARYITHRAPFEAAVETFDSWLRPESGVIKAVLELE